MNRFGTEATWWVKLSRRHENGNEIFMNGPIVSLILPNTVMKQSILFFFSWLQTGEPVSPREWMRQEKISIANMSAILGGHYLGKRGCLDALLLGWEYFWLLMITRKLPRQGDSSQVECLVEQVIGADIRELLADQGGFARLSRAEQETGLLFQHLSCVEVTRNDGGSA